MGMVVAVHESRREKMIIQRDRFDEVLVDSQQLALQALGEDMFVDALGKLGHDGNIASPSDILVWHVADVSPPDDGPIA